MKAPWSYKEYDSRVYIRDATGRVVTEVIPGQVKGVMVTQRERVLVAALIVDCVNLAFELLAAKKADSDG